MKTRDEDFVEQLIIGSTHAYCWYSPTLAASTAQGVRGARRGSRGQGKHIGNLVALQPGESVRAILNVRDLEEASKFVFFTTRMAR